jgi:hypothetical protein
VLAKVYKIRKIKCGSDPGISDMERKSNLQTRFLHLSQGFGAGSGAILFGSWIRIQIRIRVKNWILIRIRIEVKNQELSRLNL